VSIKRYNLIPLARPFGSSLWLIPLALPPGRRTATGRPIVDEVLKSDFAADRLERAVTPLFRSLAVTLALSAMLLRAVVPAGWMPNMAGAEGTPFAICSTDGMNRVPVHQDPARGSQDEHGFACPFAGIAHLAPPQLAVALPQPLVSTFLAPHFAEPRMSSHAGDPGHAPRGPPVTV
jgi:Protein of unknown function (DUF2946)